MLAYYLQVKWVHIAAVLASGGLFALRGLLLQLGAGSFTMAWPLRFLSYGIDTVLLTAALMLFTMLPHAMFANGWLATKLLLLPVYVVLGSFALRPGRTARARLLCDGQDARVPRSAGRARAAWLAALAVYATMLGIARMHDPLGWLRLIAG